MSTLRSILLVFEIELLLMFNWYQGQLLVLGQFEAGELLSSCLIFGQNLRLGPKQLGCLYKKKV